MRKPVIAASLVLGAVLVGAAVFAFEGVSPALKERASRVKSADKIRSLLLLQFADAGPARPLPPFHGKRFILWLVASQRLDSRVPRNLDVLFSPADATRSVDKAGGAAAYQRITLATLQTGSIDFKALTSFAGPGLFLASSSDPKEGRPLIADVSFEDGANIGFSNGAVRWFSRADLGIPPGVPITVGPSSPSPLLRGLSDD